MKFRTKTVTPAMAERWLTKNASNRGVSEVRVSAYARDMKRKRWYLVPHGLVFNVKGDLLDGQHRLMAVVRSGQATEMVVVTGCDHEVRKFIDRGRARSFADLLRMRGMESNVVLKAAIARNLVQLARGSTREMVTSSEAEEALLLYPDGFAWLDSASLCRGYYRAPYLAAVLWTRKVGGQAVEEFHKGVQTGVGLTTGSPALAMRKVLDRTPAGGYASQTELLLKTLACIKASIDGAKLERVVTSSRPYVALATMLKVKTPKHGTLVDVG